MYSHKPTKSSATRQSQDQDAEKARSGDMADVSVSMTSSYEAEAEADVEVNANTNSNIRARRAGEVMDYNDGAQLVESLKEHFRKLKDEEERGMGEGGEEGGAEEDIEVGTEEEVNEGIEEGVNENTEQEEHEDGGAGQRERGRESPSLESEWSLVCEDGSAYEYGRDGEIEDEDEDIIEEVVDQGYETDEEGIDLLRYVFTHHLVATILCHVLVFCIFSGLYY